MAVTSREKSSAVKTGAEAGPPGRDSLSPLPGARAGFLISKTVGHFVQRIRFAVAFPNRASS